MSTHLGGTRDGLNAYQRHRRNAALLVNVVHARAVLAADLAAVVARHGDRAREACDRIAEDVPGVLEAAGIELDTPGGRAQSKRPPAVVAANDDAEHVADPYLCRCAECEGRDDRGEGDA